MKLPTLYMTISTGWAIRNFVYTGIVGRLSERFRVILICDPALHTAVVEAVIAAPVETIVYDARAEPVSWRLMRQLRKKVYLDSRNSRTEEIWDAYGNRPVAKRVSGAAIKAMAKLFGPTWLNNRALAVDRLLNRTSAADDILRDAPADSFFLATHASTFFEESLFRAARQRCKHSILMILSWDHLSSKIILGPGFDDLFVWNSVSKQEILATMDYYEPDQIHIVGAPQFDIYAEPTSLSYADWCGKFGLDVGRLTILFSTIPQVRNDGQHRVLAKMAERFQEQPELFGNVQILVKVHPLDDASVYADLERSPLIRVSKKGDDPASVQQDYALDANRDALTHALLNINIFSTMTLEAAQLDCPIVHLAFDLEGQTNSVPTEKYYEFAHFQPITSSGCAAMSRSFEEFMANIALVIEGDEQRAPARRAIAERYFSETIGRSTDRVFDQILRIAGLLQDSSKR